MLEPRIQQQFFEAADLQNQAASILARPVAQAAEVLWGCFTNGAKVMVAGCDAGGALASVIGAAFAGRFERARPPLPAMTLRDDAGATLAQQVLALGQPGDVFLALDTGGRSEPLRQAAEAAHNKDMTLIVLTGADIGPWRQMLLDTDVHIAVPHERAARVAETQLLVLHSLCDAVDLQLMGEQESL
jgi:D-sedoheptulose 7-phosphate isomerase